DYWTSQIAQCIGNQPCIRSKRIDVSNAFFYELEYQQTGSYVYRLYRAAYGNTQPASNPDAQNAGLTADLRSAALALPSYSAFVSDRAKVIGGSNLAASQLALADAFVQRPDFDAKYPAGLDGSAFVDALLTTIRNDIGVDLTSQKSALLDLYNQGGGGHAGRGVVMYRLANDDGGGTNGGIYNGPLIDAEYSRAFVFTQYAGYLRRDSDIQGYLFWLGQVTRFPVRDVPIQHAMVCS